MAKRYTVRYVSGATGYGWEHETNSRQEAEKTARQMSESYSASVDVWDSKESDFIFDKHALDYKPRIDKF